MPLRHVCLSNLKAISFGLLRNFYNLLILQFIKGEKRHKFLPCIPSVAEQGKWHSLCLSDDMQHGEAKKVFTLASCGAPATEADYHQTVFNSLYCALRARLHIMVWKTYEWFTHDGEQLCGMFLVGIWSWINKSIKLQAKLDSCFSEQR